MRTPRTQPFDLGGVRANLRLDEALCDAEPHFLIDDVSSMNGLLRRFTADLPEARELTQLQLAALEDAVTRLPDALASHQRTLTAVRRCEFSRRGAWPSLLERGEALVAQARARLDEAPDLLRRAKLARAREDWEADRRVNERGARRSCPAGANAPRIYFAWTDGELTTWLFCDGTRAMSRAQGPLEFEPPPSRPWLPRYELVVKRYPADAIDAPPGADSLSRR